MNTHFKAFLFVITALLGMSAINIHNDNKSATTPLTGTNSTSTAIGGGCIQVAEDTSTHLGQRLCADNGEQLQRLLNEYVKEQQENGKEKQAKMKASKLALAISQHETGHRNIPGKTGELATKYQFMPKTWASLAKRYLGDAHAPTTERNQDTVAITHIDTLLKSGYSIQQVAMIWNGGKPYRRVGTTKTKDGKTIKYDTKAYADKVLAIYATL